SKQPSLNKYLIILGISGALLLILVVVLLTRRKEGEKKKEEEAIPEAYLEAIDPRIGPLKYRITKKVTTIGKQPEVDIHIDQPTVSRTHALIIYEDNTFYILDQDSTNGTLVKGKEIKPREKVPIFGGDEIFLDRKNKFRFVFIVPAMGPPMIDEEKTVSPEKTVVSSRRPEQTKTLVSDILIPHQKEKLPSVTDKPFWEIGDVIDGLYRVWGMDTSGGMGTVYFVEHLGWKTNLAVKTIKPELLRDKKLVKAFIREAETWVDLGLYPHIVSCFYVREMRGLLRIFAEYVDGGSLKEALSEGRIKEFKTILDLAIQFCRGMDYAHRRGLIHRDIKPGNCLLTRDGTLKITDFGLTKAVGGAMPELGIVISGAKEGSLSLFGGGAGTPEYMAPEQFEGKADFSSDIYSFGVMLFEMVCGRRPFVMPDNMHPSARSWYYQKVHNEVLPPDPGELRPDCPEGLSRLILQCLGKEKEKRPKSFREIEEGLIGLYEEIVGEAYSRPRVDEIPLVASDLNNRALSLLDLGKKEEAERLLRTAVEKDPAHPEAVYNLTFLEWRSGRIDDLGAVNRMEEVCKAHPGEWLPLYLLASIHLEREDNEKALSVLEEVKDANPEVKELYSLAQRSPGSRCIRTFEGHEKRVTSVCFSPDGRYALSGSLDGTLKLWDVATERCLRTFQGHEDSVESVCFSPDGRYALSGGHWTLKLWDVATGRCLRTFEGHEDSVESVCFSPDGRYALSGSSDNTLKLWDVATGRCLRTFEGHKGWVHSVSFSPDGRYALSGGHWTLKLWDVATGRCLRTFEGHKGSVESVCFSPDGRYALSGSGDETFKLWSLKRSSAGASLRLAEVIISSIISSRHERFRMLISQAQKAITTSPLECLRLTGEARTIPGFERSTEALELWFKLYQHFPRRGLQTAWESRTFEGHKSSVTSVCFSPDGRYALSGSVDGTLKLWDIATGECLI
ncbi:MAG: hypothetical protein DRN29_09885, partial [Thermoplasmata archaeon]